VAYIYDVLWNFGLQRHPVFNLFRLFATHCSCHCLGK